MVFSAWPTGRAIISGWLGGGKAWEVNRAGPRAIEDFARAELRRNLGGGIDDRLSLALLTQWGDDAYYQGAYAYARPGEWAARARLGIPLADGRLQLAGEACNDDGLAGTLAGAWNAGTRAAERITFPR
jgi:monoamine oxidase